MADASNILIVEDDGIIAEDIHQTLLRLGYRVPRTARSAEEAIRCADELDLDLVLMDIKLKGGMDGIEATLKIKERHDLPVVYLTSHSDEATLARARRSGPHGYLLKPFNERDLRTAIEVAIGKYQIEQRLLERERWFATTLRSIGDAVIATDPQERVTFLNSVAEQLTGWSSDEAEGRQVADVFRLVDAGGAPLEGPARRALRDRFSATIPSGTQLRMRDGQLVDVDDKATPIVDDRGAIVGGVVVFRDISERRRLEERVARSERLASIGTLAAGVAHEINNPLAVTAANLEYASDELSKILSGLANLPGALDFARRMADVQGALADASTASDRVRRIVLDLRKFGRADVAEHQLVDLPNVIEAARRLTENQLRHAAVLRVELGTTPLVLAEEGGLTQVVTNLLVNAAQAIGEGNASANEICLTTRTDSGGRAVVEIRDTGPGIAPGPLARIFDPFFTTRPVGSGMGLGLAISHAIVVSLGGEISVETEVGRGATFRVALPPATRPRAPTA